MSNKCVIEDVGTRKYVIGSFMKFQMNEEKDVASQIYDIHVLSSGIKIEESLLLLLLDV